MLIKPKVDHSTTIHLWHNPYCTSRRKDLNLSLAKDFNIENVFGKSLSLVVKVKQVMKKLILHLFVV